MKNKFKDFDDLYIGLERDVKKFQNAFIEESYIEKIDDSSRDQLYKNLIKTDETLSIRMQAYIVSTHGIFERFFEDLALKIIDESEYHYDKKKKINIFLVNLMNLKNTKIQIEINKVKLKDLLNAAINQFVNKKQQEFSTLLKDAIMEIEKNLKTYIKDNNSVKNNQKTAIYDLLRLIGINKVDEITNQQLLDFIGIRGDFAHKGEINSNITPATAQTYIDNMLIIAKDTTEQAKILIEK